MKVILETLCGCTREMDVDVVGPRIEVAIKVDNSGDSDELYYFRGLDWQAAREALRWRKRPFEYQGERRDGLRVYRELATVEERE